MSNRPDKARLNRTPSGNALTEYGLIAAIVLGASCVALSNLGDNVSDLFKSMLSTKAQESTAGSNPKPTTNEAGMPPLQAGEIQITLSDGTTIRLPDHPQDLTRSVMTAGANGTTHALANTLKAIATQLQEKGAITQAEFNTLIALSNQGHRIADVQKAIEAVAQKSKTPSEFSASLFQFDGNTYTLDGITSLIGFDNGSMDPNAVTNPLTDPTACPEMSTFQELFKKAQRTGALDDPVLRNVVKTLSVQILSISDLNNIAAYNIADYYAPTSSMAGNIVSNLTDYKAVGICGAGNGVDSGVQCSAG
jgi:Flp pilus assembly pilin Flp